MRFILPAYSERMRRLLILSLVCLLSASLARGDDDDHERARRARAAGAIQPLSQILAQVESSFSGRLIEVELEDEDDPPVYEIELLSEQGNVIELTYDARSGKFLKAEGKGVDAARKQR